MIEFILKRVAEDSPHYNLTFMKETHKRDGSIVTEPGDTLYTLSLPVVKYTIAHSEANSRIGDQDISLKEYIICYKKCYKEICELLKKIL